MLTNKRRCPKCLKKKSLDAFKKRPGGTYSYCYACALGYYREYNAKRYATPEARQAELQRTKDKYHASVKPRRIERKRKLIALMGGKCQECGYSRSAAALDFHHRNPVDKQRTVSHLLAMQEPEAWDMAVEEAKKCDLICSNCHREHTYPGHEL